MGTVATAQRVNVIYILLLFLRPVAHKIDLHIQDWKPWTQCSSKLDTRENYWIYAQLELQSSTLPRGSFFSHPLYPVQTEVLLNHYNEIIRVFKQKSPENVVYHRKRGLCHWNVRKLDMAEFDFRKALQIVPSSIACRIDLITVLLEAGKYDEAQNGENAKPQYVHDIESKEKQWFSFVPSSRKYKYGALNESGNRSIRRNS